MSMRSSPLSCRCRVPWQRSPPASATGPAAGVDRSGRCTPWRSIIRSWLDGEIYDWAGLPGITVPLSRDRGRRSGRAAPPRSGAIADLSSSRSGTIRPRAICTSPIWNEALRLTRRPSAWRIASRSPSRISGAFTGEQARRQRVRRRLLALEGAPIEPRRARARQVVAGFAHPVRGARAFETPSGGTVHLARPSDAGDQLYKMSATTSSRTTSCRSTRSTWSPRAASPTSEPRAYGVMAAGISRCRGC